MHCPPPDHFCRNDWRSCTATPPTRNEDCSRILIILLETMIIVLLEMMCPRLSQDHSSQLKGLLAIVSVQFCSDHSLNMHTKLAVAAAAGELEQLMTALTMGQ